MTSFKLEKVQVSLGVPFTPRPFVRGWNRLEGRPRAENFERALRAEARDPLWFLTRQWQFLELKGDDAGSPIEARIALRQTKLARYSARGGSAQPFPAELPLEAVVEREAVPIDRVALIQVHRAFDKALHKGGLTAAQRAVVHAKLRTAYPLAAAHVDGVDDVESQQLGALADAQIFDAATFLSEIPAAFDTRVDADPALAAIAAETKQAARDTAEWYAALYTAPPTAADDAWVPSQLDYQFACATEPGDGQIVLTATGYTGGHLDWYAVDVAETNARLGERAAGAAPTPPLETTLSMVPAAVTFAGMPSERFWELENRKVEFGALTAHTTDIGKMLFTEFMLVYGNDWCVVPFEVEVGSLCEMLGMVVSDIFGDLTLVRAADRGRDEEWRRWALFGLETLTPNDTAVPRLFIPPATPKLLESAPIERVVFLRDEMANMCWAVERTVPSRAGIGIDGEQYALAVTPPPTADPPPAPGATASYRLGTSAPPNWRPFVPVHVPGSLRSVRLQRARLPIGLHNPLGKIIAEPGPYYINEEEVPRAGRIVVRTFQRTRWIDGRVILWLGRRSMTGRGEGSSGLLFDKLEEITLRE
jgi:hypothetical protein